MNNSEKELYKELLEMLHEWYVMLYHNKDKGMDIFLSRNVERRYRVIRSFLIQHLKYNIDFQEYIEMLPKNTWILKRWLVEIVFGILGLIVGLGNPYFFKIYTGITISISKFSFIHSETDVIYIIAFLILVPSYFFCFIKRITIFQNLQYALYKINETIRKHYATEIQVTA